MISIVVPVFNEEEVLPQLYERVSRVMENTGIPFELIFVDDGSIDNSLELLSTLHQKNANVKVLELSRNFGHQMAIAAGLDYASGEAVVTMDSDLQHPPEMIPDLIRKWKEGYDIVYTCRTSTEDTGFFKNMTSSFFYAAINRLSEVNVPQGAADFRLMDHSVVEAFRLMGESSLFLRGLVSWVGYKQVAIPYEAAARYGGKSKYSFLRMLRFAIDGVTSFSSIPLYVSAFIGLIISVLSFIYAIFAIYARLFTDLVVEGWTSVMVMVLFLGGILLITLGIQGMYLGRIYKEVKGRPRYLVRRTYGFEE